MSDRASGKLDPFVILIAGVGMLLLLPVLVYLLLPAGAWGTASAEGEPARGAAALFGSFFATANTNAYVLFVVFCCLMLISIFAIALATCAGGPFRG